MHRRRFLQGVALTTAVIVAPEARADLAAEAAEVPTHKPQEAELWALMAPYAAGSVIGLGWQVNGLSNGTPGTMLLTLQHVSGERAEVRVCGRAGAPRGVAYCDHVDLILMNHGDGRQPTDEDIGRVLETLARRMRRNEKHGVMVSRSRLVPHAMGAGHFNGR